MKCYETYCWGNYFFIFFLWVTIHELNLLNLVNLIKCINAHQSVMRSVAVEFAFQSKIKLRFLLPFQNKSLI